MIRILRFQNDAGGEDKVEASSTFEPQLLVPTVYFSSNSIESLNIQKFVKDGGFDNPSNVHEVVREAIRLENDSLKVYSYFVKTVFPKYLSKQIPQDYHEEAYNKLLNQAILYKNINSYTKEFEIINSSFSDLIFNQVSSQLSKNQFQNPELSNSYGFQKLVQKCIENNYYPDLKENSADKFVKTLLEEDYFHLINTTYQKSSFVLKIVLIVIFGLVIFGLFNVFKLIKK